MPYQPKVLVVDDDENILSAFETFLKKEHCSMIPATSAEDALEILERGRVDLLVTDIRLKRTSGITFLFDVKVNHPQLPVIVITGYPGLIAEKDAKTCGADYFFLKPLEINKLRDAVKKCLHLNSR